MKITKYIMSLAAAAGLVAACQMPEMVQMVDLSKAIAPVMHDIDSAGVKNQISIAADNQTSTVTFTWDAADFGVNTQIDYAVEASYGEKSKVAIVSGITKTEASQSYEALNQIMYNTLGVPAGTPTEVDFFVSAKVGEYQKLYSDPVKVNVTVTAAEKVYPMVYVIGSFNGWADGTTQELFDFEGTDANYSGVVGFSGKAAEGFKVRGSEIGWVNELGNWGLDGSADAPAPEAETVSLISDGGSSDIKIYSKDFYNFTLNKAAPSLTVNFSFATVGVIGTAVGGWDADKDLKFDTTTQKFYLDATLVEGEMKFRADDDWTLNWGVSESAEGTVLDKGSLLGDKNIKVPAGNYRIYLNLNNPDDPSFALSAEDYGKEEEVVIPDPPVMVGWGIVGSITNWGNLTEDKKYIADIALTSDGTWYGAKGVEIPEGAEIKFRLDGAWTSQWGLGSDPFVANQEMTLSNDGGSGNIKPAAGTYDIYLNPETGKAWFINNGNYPGGGAAPEASEWGLIGSLAACASWSNNISLFVEGDYSVARGVVFAAGDQFKFRKGNSWGVELTYEGAISIDSKLPLIDGTGGKQNSSISKGGTFDVFLANDLSAFYVMTPGKTPASAGEAEKVYIDPSADNFVVGFSGSAIGWDDPSFDTKDRASFVSKNVTDAATYSGTYEFKLEGFTVAVADQFKIRINGQWVGVGGATLEGINVGGSDNFEASEAGVYNVTISFAWNGETHSDVKAVFAK